MLGLAAPGCALFEWRVARRDGDDELEPQPAHRHAQQREQITWLDDSAGELDAYMWVIADATQALAVAGIMGGASSAVSSATQHVLLEAAFFVPQQHAGKARQLGMHTDSSHRFERGVDRLCA